jgi:large subunit ribosomal protein L13
LQQDRLAAIIPPLSFRISEAQLCCRVSPYRFICYLGVVMKTFSAKSETVQRDWYVVDASGKTLGRLCTELARRLRGKHKPVYTPHVDTGDYLVVINAEKIIVTGNKLADKKYHRFTGYIGNLKTETLGQALERHPERVIETGVKGMLPKNPLGRAMYRKLKVYKGSEHPHTAQQPQLLDI